jgi:hypothetical protein
LEDALQRNLAYGSFLFGVVFAGALLVGGCDSGAIGQKADTGPKPNLDQGKQDSGTKTDGPPVCTGGNDKDGDGYGLGCPAGPDCNDDDKYTYPGATEVCDGKDNNCDGKADEGLLNACGTCDPTCAQLGTAPFPVDPLQDPNVQDVNGVGLDPNGDLKLDKTKKNFNYMWIANTNDLTQGTISKVDTKDLKEVARYFSVTCKSKAGATGCVDLHGKPISTAAGMRHTPSRTAVDYNFDVWVANRAIQAAAPHGQPSATKIANDPADCIDRNGNKVIDTSADRDGDGVITVDCDGDGSPDTLATTCTVASLVGKKPEFLGDDDECVLFTVNYGDSGDLGRSICLGGGIEVGASAAWVGTYSHPGQNRFFKIAKDGKLSGPYPLTAGHNSYGCAIDRYKILWSVNITGNLTFLNTLDPTKVGPNLTPPWPSVNFYGIGVDDKADIWLGGWSSTPRRTYRYKPDRSGSFAALGNGTWTGIQHPTGLEQSRGIAADDRGKVWVAINNGYIWRVEQSLADGLHDLSADKNYWPTGGSTVIGVGVDFSGNIWGISHAASVAARLDVDAKGDPVAGAPPMTDTKRQVKVGTNPYTYSDFTGFGLQNFTAPQGRYLYELDPCNGKKATWTQVRWNATVPPGTSLEVRVRSGDNDTNFGAWVGPFGSSPAPIGKGATMPVTPNPARRLQIEFTFKSPQQSTSPILHDFDVAYNCTQTPG